MKKAFWIAGICAALAGCGLHFLYDIFPVPLVALLAPVNESVWEHLKLLYWPTLGAACVLSRKAEQPQRLWSAFFFAELSMPVFLMGIYYLLKTGFGVERLSLDIFLYFLTMGSGFLLAQRLYTKSRPERCIGLSLLLFLLYGISLLLFSFGGPDLEVFTAPTACIF